MQKNLTIILIILLYSCGDDGPITPPPSIDYHTDDQQFIDNLVLSNNSIENEDVVDRITTTDFIDDSTGSKYYKIKQLNLNNMSLGSIPNSIIYLDSLKILDLSNNQIEFLPEDICTICLEEFKFDEELKKLKCNHIYHKECLKPWLDNKKKCPICRADIV